jgi:integrase
MSAACLDNVRGMRDRALLLVGWAGGFRRSELVSLDLEDLEEHADGMTIHLGRSKTDQEGRGRILGIPFGKYQDDAGEWITCPVRAVRAWADAAGLEGGPLFRSVRKGGHVGDWRLSDRSVDNIIRELVIAAGYNPRGFSSHSLRSGVVTSAYAAGVSERRIMVHTGHRSVAQLRDYERQGTVFVKNPLDCLL